MTKMHFQLIADVISGLALRPDQRREVAFVFAHSLRKTNPAFDQTKFREACMSEGDKAVEADRQEELKAARAYGTSGTSGT